MNGTKLTLSIMLFSLVACYIFLKIKGVGETPLDGIFAVITLIMAIQQLEGAFK